jgi:hypothetical protein
MQLGSKIYHNPCSPLQNTDTKAVMSWLVHWPPVLNANDLLLVS